MSILKQGVMANMCSFSDKDPGGLLLLAEKGDLADMNISEVLAVMSTLLCVAAREVTDGSSSFLHLFLGTHDTAVTAFPFSPHLQYKCGFVPMTIIHKHNGFPSCLGA